MTNSEQEAIRRIQQAARELPRGERSASDLVTDLGPVIAEEIRRAIETEREVWRETEREVWRAAVLTFGTEVLSDVRESIGAQ